MILDYVGHVGGGAHTLGRSFLKHHSYGHHVFAPVTSLGKELVFKKRVLETKPTDVTGWSCTRKEGLIHLR